MNLYNVDALQFTGVERGERLEVGDLLKDRFLLERELGRDDMGVVYLARDEHKPDARERDAHVVVRIFNNEFARRPDALAALRREVRRAQQLDSGHVVLIHDVDHDNAHLFTTMEYVEGSDLRALLRGNAHRGMRFDEARPLIDGMGEALRRAHDADIVHSDFKPASVMVSAEGVARVLDFGVALAGKRVVGAGDGSAAPRPSAYASLESIQGKPPTPADDVYAFGCVVFELLTGHHPFENENAEEAMRQGRRPPPVPGLGTRQYKALRDSVAFTADKRSADIAEVLAGLGGQRTRHWRQRAMPWLAAAGLVLALSVAAAWVAALQVEGRHVTETLRRFAPGQSDSFTDEAQVRTALATLDGSERRRLVMDGAQEIDGFLARLVATHWDPAHGKLDYAGTAQVFGLSAELKSFAPRLQHRREDLAHERDDALNRLDTALNNAIASGRLFGNGVDEVPAILGQIRTIDPSSKLLANPELELKLDMAIGDAIAAGDMATAEKRLAIARDLYNSSTRLAARGVALTLASAPKVSKPPAPVSSIAGRTADAPAEGLAAISTPTAAADLQRAEHEARLESLRRATAAGDLDKAIESFQTLRQIDGGSVETNDEAANLLTHGFLESARQSCRAGHWKEAAQRIDNALEVIGERDDLRRALTRYDLAVAIMTAAKAPAVSTIDEEDLHKRLEAVEETDPDGLKDLETAMSASKALPGGSLSAVVRKLRTRPPASSTSTSPPCARHGSNGTASCFD